MENHFYLGIDMDNQYAVISYYQLNKKEPETISMIAGSERFQIPLAIAKHGKTWLIGEEAQKEKERGGVMADRLLFRAAAGELITFYAKGADTDEKFAAAHESYTAREVLCIYIKRLMFVAGSMLKPVVPDMLVITLDKLSREATDLFLGMAPSLGLRENQITLIERRQSFYYFAYSQREELYRHDVCLFDYRGDTMSCFRLQRNLRTTPQLLIMEEKKYRIRREQADSDFFQVAQQFMRGHIIATVYLVGDGFDGEWMKSSLAFLCKGHRVFLGKNLYSKGACYAAAVKADLVYWPFVYMGATEMKVNVSLKVKNCGKLEFFTLISAGDNWYEKVGECEVILSGTPSVDFWLQAPSSREAKIEKLELSDFPQRPDKVTRLRIAAKPISDVEVKVTIKDLGFGELFQSSDKIWEYTMSL